MTEKLQRSAIEPKNPLLNASRNSNLPHVPGIRVGGSLDRVVRVHVVLADISHMAEMERVYREFFPVDPPARTAWSMQLRFGNGCEIECVALAG